MEKFLLYHYRSQNHNGGRHGEVSPISLQVTEPSIVVHNGGRHGEVSPISLQVTEPQWRATWRGFSYIITGHRTTMGGRHGETSPGFSYIITGHRTTMEGDMERFLLYHYRSQNHNGGRHGEVSPISLQVTEPQWRATWRGFSYIITGHRTTMEGDMERFLLYHYRSQNHNGGATWRGFSYIITGHRTTMEGDMERFLLYHISLQVTEPQWRATWRGFSYIITGHRTTMEGDMESFSYIITDRTTMEGDEKRRRIIIKSENWKIIGQTLERGAKEVSPISLQVTEPQWRATWRGFSYIITGHRTTMEGDMERFLLYHYRSQNHNGGRHGEVSPISLQVTEPQWRATWRGFSYIITGHRTTMEGDMERFLLYHYRSQNHNGGGHKRSDEEL